MATSIWFRWYITSFLGLLLAGIAGTAYGSSVTFTDGTFNPSDWTLTVMTSGNGGSTSVTTILTGGNPDEYRRIVNSVNSGTYANRSNVFGFHIRVDAVYNPSTQGAIDSIDYSEDTIMFSGSGEGQATGAVIQQGTQLFFAPRLLANQSSWTHQSILSLKASDFITFLPSTLHPDFSPLGGPITFGFYTANTAPGSAYTIVAGIDNWFISANPVPLPGAVWLLGSGLLGLVGLKRKLLG